MKNTECGKYNPNSMVYFSISISFASFFTGFFHRLLVFLRELKSYGEMANRVEFCLTEKRIKDYGFKNLANCLDGQENQVCSLQLHGTNN